MNSVQSPNMLALDTACGEIAAAISVGGERYYADATNEHGRTRSTAIVPLLDGLLSKAGISWSDLNLLAFGAGPGAFTGLRIAAATLAGINSGLQLPILHLSSLAVSARQCSESGPIWVLEDARAGEVYAGCYERGVSIEADRCMRWDQFVADVDAANYICYNTPPVPLDGWQQCEITGSRAIALLDEAMVGLGRSALDALPHYPEPRYLQRSQAEKNFHG